MNMLPHILFLFHYLLVCVADSTLKTWKAVVMNFIWQQTEPKPNSSVLLRPPTMGNLTGLKERHIITELSWNTELGWRMFYTCGQSHICRLIQNENGARKFLRWMLHKKEIKDQKKKNKATSWLGLPWYTKIKKKKLLSLHLSPFTFLVKNKEFFTQSNV